MGVIDQEEAMFWATGIDTSGLDMGAQKIEQIFRELTGKTGRSFDRLNTSFQVFEKVKDVYSKGVFELGKSLIQLGASANVARVAASAFMGVATAGIGIAITGVVALTKKWIDKKRELREEFNKFNKTVAETAGSQITSLMKLSRQWTVLGGNLQEKKRFLVENGAEIKKLTNKTLDLVDADNLFIKNTSKYVEALILRARADAKINQVTPKTERLAEIDTELESTSKFVQVRAGYDKDGRAVYRDTDKINMKWVKLQQEKKNLIKETEKIIQEGVKLSDEEKKLLKDLGLGAEEISEGSIARVKQHISELEKQYERADNYIDRHEIKRKIDAQKNLLKSMDVINKDDNSSSKNKIENLSIGVKESLLKLEAEKIDILENGKNKRLKQSEQEWKEEQARLDKEHQERLKKYKEQKKSMPQEEIDTYNERKKTADDAKTKRDTDIEKEYAKEYKEQLKGLTDIFLNEEERKKQSIKDRYDKEREWAGKQLKGGSITKEEYDVFVLKTNEAEIEEQKQRLLDSVEDLKKKELDINKKYDMLIADAQSQANAAKTENEKQIALNLLDLLVEGREKALSELQSQMLQETDEWKNLFLNLDNLTADQIDSIVETIESKLGGLKLKPADLKALNDQLTRAKNVSDELKSENPFAGIINSIGKYKKGLEELKTAQEALSKARESGADAKTLDGLSKATNKAKNDMKKSALELASDLNKINSTLGTVGDSLSSVFASFGNDAAADAVNSITQIGGGALTAGQGVAKLASGDIVGGISDLAKGLADVITGIVGVSDAEKQKKIDELQKSIDKTSDHIDSLVDAYEDLERASRKAFSSTKADMIAEQAAINQKEIEARKKQNEDYKKMIETEKSKKNPDEDVIKGWEDAIKENEKTVKELGNAIEDSKDAFIESITGTDVMQAIDRFAQAYADAFISGNDAAKASADFIKDMMKNSLMEALKDDLSPYVSEYMKKFAEYFDNDGVIDSLEQAELDAIKTKMDKTAENYKAKMESLGLEDNKSGVTGELKAEMTEQTGSQLVGLWNMTAMDIRAIKEYFERNPINGHEKELSDMLNHLNSINQNTRETADNTNGLKDELSEMNNKLDDIKNNTKPNNSRG